jgi:hypothetical protein
MCFAVRRGEQGLPGFAAPQGDVSRMNIRHALLATIVVLGGCLHDKPVLEPAHARAFVFGKDTFAFRNELRWHYRMDPVSGEREVEKNPDAEYSLHCFVMARSARQFFQFARFDPAAPKADDETYRKLVRDVVDRDPSETETAERIVVPGYANLHAFSAAHEDLVKDELGSAAQSYVQRGHWRMVFPFTHDQQAETAKGLFLEITVHRPPVVHLILFPKITINHGVLIYDAAERGRNIVFRVYDPNNAQHPTELVFDGDERAFKFPRSAYFPGGVVDVYEVYKSAIR